MELKLELEHVDKVIHLQSIIVLESSVALSMYGSPTLNEVANHTAKIHLRSVYIHYATSTIIMLHTLLGT